MRQQAGEAVREEQTVQSVAAAYGVNERSVFRWLAYFANGGQHALLAKPISGRPSKLRAEELSRIPDVVRDHNLQQFKFEFGLRALSLIRNLIKRQFKKELSVSSVHRLMRMLGFSAQKPLYQEWQQDPVLVRTWETETYPAIRGTSQASRSHDLLWRRVGYPLGLPHRQDLGAAGPDMGGAGDGPAPLAEHVLGGQHAG